MTYAGLWKRAIAMLVDIVVTLIINFLSCSAITIFWIIGLPMGNTTTQVEMDMQLTPAGDPTNVLWSFAMEFEGRELDGPYYGLEDSVISYPVALQDALRPAISDLAEKAPTRLKNF